jgi:hypothetical protein
VGWVLERFGMQAGLQASEYLQAGGAGLFVVICPVVFLKLKGHWLASFQRLIEQKLSILADSSKP